MRFYCLFFVLAIQVSIAKAQQIPRSKGLEVSWKFLQNDSPQKGQFRASFIFKNVSSKPVDLAGSTIYFSYPREILKVTTANANFKNLGGEFKNLEFEPMKSLIAPGALLQITYVAKGKTMNRTDAPSGLYWLDKEAMKTDPVQNFKADLGDDHEMKLIKLAAEKEFLKNSATKEVPHTKLIKILPSPVSYRETGEKFMLSAQTSLIGDDIFSHEGRLFSQELAKLIGKRMEWNRGGSNNFIQLRFVEGLMPEHYTLSVAKDKILISSSTNSGIFYGLQSLKQLMPPISWAKVQDKIVIPTVEVKDGPRFGYRSFMLDVARNFQPKSQIFKLLDLLAMYKINTFHFHLNDDEGWRLAIAGLPELTEVGAMRGHDLAEASALKPAYGSGPQIGEIPGSGFYSRQDFIDILNYARQRHIRVIPEIETPGHARAAIKAMDARYRKFLKIGKLDSARQFLLRDTLDQSLYRSVQGYPDNVMNIALPSTYNFIAKVIDELISMYKEAKSPLDLVQLGGDEVPKGVWEKSPEIASLMKNENVKSYDDLWYYYIDRVSKLLKFRNLNMGGWEEIAMRKVLHADQTTYIANPDFSKNNFQVYVWNNVWGGGNDDLAYRLANAGYKVVLSSVTNYYFDLAYNQNPSEPGLYWGGYVDVDKAFYFSPFDYYKTATEDAKGEPLSASAFDGKLRLDSVGRQNIVGLQSQLWSEKVTSVAGMEYMLLPKLLGYAERAWAKEPKWSSITNAEEARQAYLLDWNNFATLLGKRELLRLNYVNGGFAYRVPPPGLLVKDGMIEANRQFPGLSIKYTTDGTEPHINSKDYVKALPLSFPLQFKTFVGQHGSKTITLVK